MKHVMYLYSILGLSWDNGTENGNYYIIVYWRYSGVMENKMCNF